MTVLSDKRSWIAFILAAVVTIPLYLVPILYLFSVAVQSPEQFLSRPLAFPHPLVWRNFTNAWIQANMGKYFSNSAVYTFCSTIVSVILGMMLAFPISRRYVRGSGFMYVLFLAGMFLPVGLIPLFIESRLLHLYNNRIGYMILHLQYGLTLGFFIFAGFFRTLPKELDESAALDGCGYLKYLWSIVVPLAKPVIATVGIYTAINIWNDLIGPVVFLASDNLYPLTRGLYMFYGSYQSEWTLLAAGVFIVAAPLIIAFIILQRYFVAGIVTGSLKS